MEVTLKSRKVGKTITFSIPGSSYVFADLNGQPGTLGQQICRGGSTMGSTITFPRDGDPAKFEALCRRWLKSYVAALTN